MAITKDNLFMQLEEEVKKNMAVLFISVYLELFI